MTMHLLRELLSSSTADGSRTNALNHLQWMLAAVLAALTCGGIWHAPWEVMTFFAIVFVVLLLAYLVTHFFFMVKDPDALRSEKFKLSKMAIERGLVGDSNIGLHLPSPKDRDDYPRKIGPGGSGEPS